ncbi:hypothetical protein C8Q76DRAFT_688040 [Earliella scabrosa]|nr:hypothetical protein C8Q76DRAFT_688040 [Earliella scabrosa]
MEDVIQLDLLVVTAAGGVPCMQSHRQVLRHMGRATDVRNEGDRQGLLTQTPLAVGSTSLGIGFAMDFHGMPLANQTPRQAKYCPPGSSRQHGDSRALYNIRGWTLCGYCPLASADCSVALAASVQRRPTPVRAAGHRAPAACVAMNEQRQGLRGDHRLSVGCWWPTLSSLQVSTVHHNQCISVHPPSVLMSASRKAAASARVSIQLAPQGYSVPLACNAPFSRVFPVELLEKVFHHYLSDWHPTAFLQNLTCGLPVVLPPFPAHPQRRDVLRKASALWTTLIIHPKLDVSSFPLAISRSRHRSLSIHCIYHRDQNADNAATLEPVLERMGRAFRIASRSLARWGDLTVYTDDWQFMTTILESMSRLPNPLSLHTFRLVYTGLDLNPPFEQYLSMSAFPPSSMRSQSCALTSLTLRGCRIDWKAFAGVVSESLTDLTLDDILDRVALGELGELLQRATSLRYLRLAGFFVDMYLKGPARTSISLPNLQTLAISVFEVTCAFELLRLLRTPVVAQVWLDLHWGTVGPDEADLTFIFQDLEEAGDTHLWRSVRSLTLRSFGLALPIRDLGAARNFFRSFPSLGELTLDFHYLHTTFWQWLLDATRDGYLGTLQTLTVAGLCPIDVQEFVAARQRAGLQRVHVVFITDVTIFDPYAERKLWFTWLYANTLSVNIVRLQGYTLRH